MASTAWILVEDFEAFKFEKKDLDGSRTCFGVDPGDVGKGGKDVNDGDEGEAESCVEGSLLVDLKVVPVCEMKSPR